MNCKHYFLKSSFLILFCTSLLSVYGQGGNKESNNPYSGLPFKERLFVGGNLGASFGTITSILVEPVVGYRVHPKFSVGLGPSYQYYKDSRYNPSFETSIYGGSVFARYFPLDMIFLQSEFQLLNLETFYSNTSGDVFSERVNVPVLLVGGGYSQRSPGGLGIFIGIYYDLIGDVNSPYPDNYTFRIGGTFSL